MDPLIFEHPDWHKALTLTERAAALRRAPGLSTDNDALAERRLARWRGQEPFASDGFFARRLASDGLTETELRALLGEPPEAMAARDPAPLPWLKTLFEAFTRPAPESFPE